MTHAVYMKFEFFVTSKQSRQNGVWVFTWKLVLMYFRYWKLFAVVPKIDL